MKTFIDIEPTPENSTFFHFFQGASEGNFNELKELLDLGWCIYTWFEDSNLGQVLKDSSDEHNNQPFVSYTLVLVKTDNYRQRLIPMKKGGCNRNTKDLANHNSISERVFPKVKDCNQLLKVNLQDGFSIVGNIGGGSHAQCSWYPLHTQNIVFQKKIKKEHGMKITSH